MIEGGANTNGLTKTGSHTLALTGTNLYGGPTNVSAGTLEVNGNQSGAIGNVTVASGAKLAGKGTVGGDTTVNSGAIHAPGEVGKAGLRTFGARSSTAVLGPLVDQARARTHGIMSRANAPRLWNASPAEALIKPDHIAVLNSFAFLGSWREARFPASAGPCASARAFVRSPAFRRRGGGAAHTTALPKLRHLLRCLRGRALSRTTGVSCLRSPAGAVAVRSPPMRERTGICSEPRLQAVLAMVKPLPANASVFKR